MNAPSSTTTATLCACPNCGTPRPPARRGDDIWCCSIACYRAWHRVPTTVHPEEATTT
jgi:hypothetical protein